ncbi:MAG: hypothetical protein ACWA45_07355 [Flavobacteriales bacterium]
MNVISNKSKQSLFLALKVLIFGLTSWYIYVKIFKNEDLEFSFFLTILSQKKDLLLWIISFILLATLNWFFEVLKWKTLLAKVENISFFTALKQSLYALTVSLATPNRIGDYGAKAYFFEAKKYKQILLLNFFSNGVQMLVTLIFGLVGMYFAYQKYELPFSSIRLGYLLICFLIVLILVIVYKNKTLLIKGLTVQQIINYFKNVPLHIKIKTILYSIFRYLIFSFLFYLLILFFSDRPLDPLVIFPLLFFMYLLVSIVPNLFIFDIIIRAGVAVWVFSLVNISELTILCVVLSSWILNFVFPSVLGSYFMFTYQPKKK